MGLVRGCRRPAMTATAHRPTAPIAAMIFGRRPLVGTAVVARAGRAGTVGAAGTGDSGSGALSEEDPGPLDLAGKHAPLARDVEMARQQLGERGLRQKSGREKWAQRFLQLAGRLKTLARIVRQRPCDDAIQARRNVRVVRGRSRRAIRAARAHVLESPPRQQLPQHDAQRIDVGAAVRLRPVPDLGGRVRRPSDDVPRAGQRCVHVRTRDPEIDQLHLARKRQHDVVGRDVAVDDSEIAERVRVGKGARDFGNDVDRDGERHALARGGEARLQQPDVDAVYELLQQQQLAVDLLDADGLRDCAVRKLERDVGLAPETRLLFLRTELGVHPLEHAQLGDSARLRAQAEVDSSHAAGTGSAQQEIRPKPPKFTITRHRTAHFYPQNEALASRCCRRFLSRCRRMNGDGQVRRLEKQIPRREIAYAACRSAMTMFRGRREVTAFAGRNEIAKLCQSTQAQIVGHVDERSPRGQGIAIEVGAETTQPRAGTLAGRGSRRDQRRRPPQGPGQTRTGRRSTCARGPGRGPARTRRGSRWASRRRRFRDDARAARSPRRRWAAGDRRPSQRCRKCPRTGAGTLLPT